MNNILYINHHENRVHCIEHSIECIKPPDSNNIKWYYIANDPNHIIVYNKSNKIRSLKINIKHTKDIVKHYIYRDCHKGIDTTIDNNDEFLYKINQHIPSTLIGEPFNVAPFNKKTTEKNKLKSTSNSDNSLLIFVAIISFISLLAYRLK